MISILILGITNLTFIVVTYTTYKLYKNNYNNDILYDHKKFHKKWGVYFIQDEDKSSEIVHINFYISIKDCFYFINDLIEKDPTCTYWIIEI